MSVPSKLYWRWKLLSSSGCPPCLLIPQTTEKTLSWCFSCGKTSNELPKRFALQPIFCGETEQCQAVDEIQKNTLKQSLWQFIPLKPKVMFPFVSKKDYQLWHLSCNSHRTACLFASRAWKGLTFKEWCALIWQFQTCFNAKKKKKNPKAGQCGDLSGLFPLFTHPGKAWICALFTILNLGFRNLSQSWDFRLAYLILSRFQNIQIYQHPHSHRTGDLGIYSLIHVIHVIIFQDFILLMDLSLSLAWMVPMLSS